jgi:hypothetical protein
MAPNTPALLSGDEDAARVWRIVTAISFVHESALDVAADQRSRGLEDGFERVSVVGVAARDLAWSTNWPPGARALAVTIETLMFGPKVWCSGFNLKRFGCSVQTLQMCS